VGPTISMNILKKKKFHVPAGIQTSYLPTHSRLTVAHLGL